MADIVRTSSDMVRTSSDRVLPSPSESVFSIVDLDETSPSPSFKPDHSLFSPSRPIRDEESGRAGGGPPLSLFSPPRPSLSFPPVSGVGVIPTAVNAEALLNQAQGLDNDIHDIQLILMRVSSAVEEARLISDRAELQELASGVRKELDGAISLVKKSINGKVAAMQAETATSLKVAGCGEGTPTFHMRQTVANAMKNKLRRRRDNVLDLESRLNMGIRDTAKRRYYDVIGSSPADDLVDRLCSPAPPECKLGTLTRWEPQSDEKMSGLLKEMEIRNTMAADTGRKLSALERELAYVVEILEHEELFLSYELSVEKSNRRGMIMWILLGFVVFLFVVFVIPGLAVYLP